MKIPVPFGAAERAPMSGSNSAPTAEVLVRLRERSRSLHARGRVAEALYSLALDLFGDDSDLRPVERQWLVDALTGPVNEAATEAVDTLLYELAPVMGSAPPRVRPALAGGAPLRRSDFE